MFENIIGQEPVVSRLTSEIENRTVPPALVFQGPDYSGKCSVALEFARAVTCTETPRARWTCTCRSCTLHRHLLHPDTLLLGGRYFSREITVAADALKRDQRDPLRFLFERSVRKLARRFDHVLWEGDEKRISKAESILQQIQDQFADYLPGASLPNRDRLSEGIDKIVDSCESLINVAQLDAVPVNTIRRLAAWARVSPLGPAKAAIIENIDRLQESARNALLKTLEEPPAGVFFVLTTRRPGAVIPTIRSRARSYTFLPRNAEQSAEVISRIFRDVPAEKPSIRDYFSAKDGQGVGPLAERFLECVAGEETIELGLLEEITQTISNLGGADGFRYFMEEVTVLMESLLRAGEAGGVPARVLAQWRTVVGNAVLRFENYNAATALTIEGMYYGMREALKTHAKVH